VAINQEIIAEQKTCPVCGNDKLTIKNAVEVGNIFKLKTKFSGAFDFTAKDKDGDKQEVLMGCYGIGPSRVMGTVVEIYHDDRGIIWPEAIAPFKVHLLFIGKDNAEKETADKLYNDLQVNHIEVLYDDREEVGAGEKMADADLLGIPYRILISTKSLAENSVEYKKRAKGEAELVKIDKIIEKLK
jgi:prolyl-tRNA synthetase